MHLFLPKSAFFCLLLFCLIGCVSPNEETETPTETENVAEIDEPLGVDAADVATVDGIIGALYDVISGPAGDRDWDRLRALCKPSAQFNAGSRNREGDWSYRARSLAEYIEGSAKFFQQSAFYETEISRQVHQFAHIAQVFSTYEFRLSEAGPANARGINSLQLVYDQDRWWIVNILWDSESEATPIPAEYL